MKKGFLKINVKSKEISHFIRLAANSNVIVDSAVYIHYAYENYFTVISTLCAIDMIRTQSPEEVTLISKKTPSANHPKKAMTINIKANDSRSISCWWFESGAKKIFL